MDLDELSEWLRDGTAHCGLVEHQDGEWVIASLFSCDQLISLASAQDAVPARRDSILYALVVQLQSLLDRDEPNDPAAVETLTAFVRENWDEVLRIDREMGLGADFDSLVVPHVAGRSIQQDGLG